MRLLQELSSAISPWPWPACARGIPEKVCPWIAPYDLPLVLLARLAVDRRFAGRGLGHALISEAFRISLRAADEVGCRAIITDAYRDRIGWYVKYGFVPIEVRTARAGYSAEIAPGGQLRWLIYAALTPVTFG